MGGIAFSVRPGSVLGVTIRQSDDELAKMEPVVRMAARVVGGVFVCIGIIPLVTKRQPARVLILALCSGIIGAFVAGAILLTPQRTYETDEQGRHRMAVVYAGLVIGAAAAILLAGAAPTRSGDPPKEDLD